MNSKCPYCGNSSGLTDRRGMCVSCGGNLERVETPASFSIPDIVAFNGCSGGFSFVSPIIIDRSEVYG